MNPWQLPPAPVPPEVRAFLEKKARANWLGALWRCAGFSFESIPEAGADVWLAMSTGFSSPEKFLTNFDPENAITELSKIGLICPLNDPNRLRSKNTP